MLKNVPKPGLFVPAKSRLALCLVSVALFSVVPAWAQGTNQQDQPQVRVNYLNVCTPSMEDQNQIRSALSSVPFPRFTPDFEISRGHSSMQDAPPANYVRVRREYAATVPFVAAQYAISVDSKSIIETLVFRSREAKDILQVQLQDTVTGAPNARSVLDNDTPVDRIRIERFGKSSVVLARCPSVDQSAYEPLFMQASEVLARYRTAMGLKQIVPRELGMFAPAGRPPKQEPATKKK